MFQGVRLDRVNAADTGADDGDVHGDIVSWCPSALGVAVTPFSVVTADLDLNTMDALQDLARIED